MGSLNSTDLAFFAAVAEAGAHAARLRAQDVETGLHEKMRDDVKILTAIAPAGGQPHNGRALAFKKYFDGYATASRHLAVARWLRVEARGQQSLGCFHAGAWFTRLHCMPGLYPLEGDVHIGQRHVPHDVTC